MYLIYFIIINFLFFQDSSAIIWQTSTHYDFGDIEQHQPVEYIFKFKNNSKDTMMIDNVRTTCGCTVPDWTVEPILPDSISPIKVIYDAKKKGYFKKKIKVFVNTQRKGEALMISGQVK